MFTTYAPLGIKPRVQWNHRLAVMLQYHSATSSPQTNICRSQDGRGKYWQHPHTSCHWLPALPIPLALIYAEPYLNYKINDKEIGFQTEHGIPKKRNLYQLYSAIL